jgi:hypothetical protein
MQKSLNKKKTYLILAIIILLVFLHYLKFLQPIEKVISGSISSFSRSAFGDKKPVDGKKTSSPVTQILRLRCVFQY